MINPFMTYPLYASPVVVFLMVAHYRMVYYTLLLNPFARMMFPELLRDELYL
jgi:hypothetical protein